jgi:hypothetical protein
MGDWNCCIRPAESQCLSKLPDLSFVDQATADALPTDGAAGD